MRRNTWRKQNGIDFRMIIFRLRPDGAFPVRINCIGVLWNVKRIPKPFDFSRWKSFDNFDKNSDGVIWLILGLRQHRIMTCFYIVKKYLTHFNHFSSSGHIDNSCDYYWCWSRGDFEESFLRSINITDNYVSVERDADSFTSYFDINGTLVKCQT